MKTEGKFFFEFNKKYYSVDFCNIMYVESKRKCIYLHMKDKSEKHFSGILEEHISSFSRFIRVSKSYLINPDYVMTFGKKEVLMQDNVTISITRLYRRTTVLMLEKYILQE